MTQKFPGLTWRAEHAHPRDVDFG